MGGYALEKWSPKYQNEWYAPNYVNMRTTIPRDNYLKQLIFFFDDKDITTSGARQYVLYRVLTLKVNDALLFLKRIR